MHQEKNHRKSNRMGVLWFFVFWGVWWWGCEGENTGKNGEAVAVKVIGKF